MAFEIIEENKTSDDQKPTALVERYLEANLNIAKVLREQLRDELSHLLPEIRSLKEKVRALSQCNVAFGFGDSGDYWNIPWRIRRINEYRELLWKNWPETINEDLEEESNPNIELLEILERIEKLRVQVGHGKTNWVTEKQILQELESLERRRELLELEVKQANAINPKPLKGYGCWPYGSKYDLKRKIRELLKEIREMNPYFWNEQKQKEHKQEIVQIEKQLTPLEKRFKIVKKKKEMTTAFILELQIQIKEIDRNDEYCKLQEKVQEFTYNKDWKSLEELPIKSIEEFISKWRRDDTFRAANYTRSIQQSLANRGLSRDGWETATSPSEMIS